MLLTDGCKSWVLIDPIVACQHARGRGIDNRGGWVADERSKANADDASKRNRPKRATLPADSTYDWREIGEHAI